MSPSTPDNFVSFSDTIGGQKDSGNKASDFILGDGIAKITVSETPPVNPGVGDFWLDTN